MKHPVYHNLEYYPLVALARVPVCPWIGVVPVCPCARGSGCARVPVCPGQRQVQKSRSGTLAGSCNLSVGSPNSQSTLRGSYGRCKGRCLVWVLTLVCRIFTCKFLYGCGSCDMLKCICTVQSGSLAKSVCLRSGRIGLPPQHQHLPPQHQHHHFPLP